VSRCWLVFELALFMRDYVRAFLESVDLGRTMVGSVGVNIGVKRGSRLPGPE
jgi:hypothetical protein